MSRDPDTGLQSGFQKLSQWKNCDLNLQAYSQMIKKCNLNDMLKFDMNKTIKYCKATQSSLLIFMQISSYTDVKEIYQIFPVKPMAILTY